MLLEITFLNNYFVHIQARKYIMDSLGKRYIEGVILDLEKSWEETEPRTPLICFLSMGSDPTDRIIALGKRLKIETRSVSMGQGQEMHARRLLQHTMTSVRKISCTHLAQIGYTVRHPSSQGGIVKG